MTDFFGLVEFTCQYQIKAWSPAASLHRVGRLRGLLRQHFSKETNLSKHSQEQLVSFADVLHAVEIFCGFDKYTSKSRINH